MSQATHSGDPPTNNQITAAGTAQHAAGPTPLSPQSSALSPDAPDAVAARLRDLIAVDPVRVGALPTKAQWELYYCLHGLGDLATAATVLDQLAAQHGPLAKVLDAQATLWPAVRREEEAVGAARERAERFPSAAGELALAKTFLAVGWLEEAEEFATRLRDRDPARADGWNLLGRIALEGGDAETATAVFEELARVQPESVEARRGLARAQAAAGEEEAATATLRDFIATIVPETPPGALTAWAELAEDLGDDRTARRLLAGARLRWARRAGEIVPALAATPVGREHDDGAAPLEEFGGDESVVVAEEAVAAPDEALAAARDLFGHDGLRPAQARVVARTLAGADCLALMPTGAGKSLCYQLPAMLLPGVTVVISPLIALMQDQVGSLPPAVAERTTLINSTLDGGELRRRQAAIARGEYKLVYAAPERLRQAPFLRALASAGVSLFVIDEAHCISLWGHDFRPDYLIIPQVLPDLGHPQVLALTATATPEIAREIGQRLGRDLEQMRASVFRRNLFYEVRHLPNKEAKLRATVDVCREALTTLGRDGGSGIIYVSSREGCEQIATLLNRELKRRYVDPDIALAYHAGFPPDDRAARMERFMRGEVRIMVATVAFGMGVDKRDVRFLVHANPPKSLEAYAQESGRAGRDGEPSRCVLLYTGADKTNLNRWAKQDEFDLGTLRRCYSHLRRVLGVGWGVISSDEARPPGLAADQDARVALGILERAGLLERHPDAPRSLEVGRERAGAEPADDLWPRFLAATALEPGAYTTLDTVAVAAELGCSPAELERTLLGWADGDGPLRSVTPGGRRELCLRLVLPAPPEAAAELPRLLDAVRHENEVRVARMIRFATERVCRHAALAAHLGERLAPCRTMCDVCTSAERGTRNAEQGRRRSANVPSSNPQSAIRNPQSVNAETALTVLNCLKAMPFQVGKTGLTKVLSGSITASVKDDRVPQFGALAGLSQGRINGLLDRLIADGFIHRDDANEYRLLSLTPRGRDADLDALAAYNAAPATRAPAAIGRLAADPDRAGARIREVDAAQGAGEDAELTGAQLATLDRLKAWRTAQAHERAVPAYIIASDGMLREVARRRPATHEELLDIKGFGAAKVDTYGDAVLAILQGEG